MKKKIIIILGIIILILISYFIICTIQNKVMIEKLNSIFKKQNSIQKNDLSKIESVRCNWNIFNLEYVVIHDLFNVGRNEFYIYFFKQKNIFNFERERTGGTTVKNTTFPQLLKMVREDCYQFQKPKGTPRDKEINWRYVKYTPEPPKTKEEIEQEKKEKEELEKLLSTFKRYEYTEENRNKLENYLKKAQASETDIKELLSQFEADGYIKIDFRLE